MSLASGWTLWPIETGIVAHFNDLESHMSGPVRPSDVSGIEEPLAAVEVLQGRTASLGGMDIARVLPTKGRRTVGAWCFVDLMIPPESDNPPPLEIGPHPHIGLSTVTWLFEGEALHGDSLGTEQLIRPGQLNLMTAGHGIAHSELGVKGGLRGVQMWIAQPEGTRHGASRFEHHAELPWVDLGTAEAGILVGSLAGATSPVVVDTPLVGAEVRMRAGRVEIPAETSFEYGVVPVDRRVKVGEAIVEPGWLGLVPAGLDVLPLESEGPGTVMVLGGVPLGERIQMWWNFVARTRQELTEAWRAWQAHDTDRFGPVPSQMERIEAPPPPWLPKSTGGPEPSFRPGITIIS